MAKLVGFLFLWLYFMNPSLGLTGSAQPPTSSLSIDVLPDGCEELLQQFANDTSKFTLCVLTNARPISVCENCVNEYNRVLFQYENIQRLHYNDSEVDCRAVLTNIDRLQVVYASYNYVFNMWQKASCQLCLNGTALNDKTKTLMRLGKLFDACISNHMNGTTLNSSLCSDCQDDYLNLTNYYNTNKISKEFCMDVVDLINTTQADWSLKWKCHIPNHDSEWVLLVISFIIFLLPILFYFINWVLSQERTNELISQDRWRETLTTGQSSTSGYVVIS